MASDDSDHETIAQMAARLYPRTRVLLVVEVDLDPMPGRFHQAEDHVPLLQATLNSLYGQYHPTVKLIDKDEVIDVLRRVYNKAYADGRSIHGSDFLGDDIFDDIKAVMLGE